MVQIDYTEVGRKIRELRKEKGMTQKELAYLVDLSEGSISKYENGKVEEATNNKLSQFANALNTTLSYLLGWDDISKITTSDRSAKLAVKIRNDINAIELLETYYSLSDEKKVIAKNMVNVLSNS